MVVFVWHFHQTSVVSSGHFVQPLSSTPPRQIRRCGHFLDMLRNGSCTDLVICSLLLVNKDHSYGKPSNCPRILHPVWSLRSMPAFLLEAQSRILSHCEQLGKQVGPDAQWIGQSNCRLFHQNLLSRILAADFESDYSPCTLSVSENKRRWQINCTNIDFLTAAPTPTFLKIKNNNKQTKTKTKLWIFLTADGLELCYPAVLGARRPGQGGNLFSNIFLAFLNFPCLHGLKKKEIKQPNVVKNGIAFESITPSTSKCVPHRCMASEEWWRGDVPSEVSGI